MRPLCSINDDTLVKHLQGCSYGTHLHCCMPCGIVCTMTAAYS
jgi:hypothetical protein